MSKNAKTRLYARSNGINYELFSIQEASSGDLSINLRCNPYYEYVSYQTSPLKSHKITLHVSPQANGHTITNTLFLTDGQEIRHVGFIEKSYDPFFTLLFSSRYSRMDIDIHELKGRNKDRLIRLVEFDQSFNSLITIVFAGEAGALSELRSAIRQSRILKFRRFDLFIGYSFIHLLPMEQGDHVLLKTSNDGPEPRHGEQQPVNSIPLTSLDGGILWAEDGLLAKLRQRVALAFSTQPVERMPLLAVCNDRLANASAEPCKEGGQKGPSILLITD